MTEQEWLTSDDPLAMLVYLEGEPELFTGAFADRKVSNRKLRLFSCAMLRRFVAFMSPDAAARVPLAEAYADDTGPEPRGWPATLSSGILDPAATFKIWQDVTMILHDAEAASLLREIAGNPWRPWCVAERKYERTLKGHQVFDLEWLTPQVLTLAEAAYTERERVCPDRKCKMGYYYPIDGVNYAITHDDCRGTGRIDDGTLDPFRLALLADALEEAGCDYPELLGHLRSPRPLYRGAWSLDLIMGKS